MIEWSLDQGELTLNPIFDTRSPFAGLYDYNINFGSIKFNNRSTSLDNTGYGVIHQPPANFAQHTHYSMQFLALWGPQNINHEEKSVGVYFGCHDPHATTKRVESYITESAASFQM